MPPLEQEHGFRGFGRSKINDFSIDFSLNFHVFPNPLPEPIFRGTKRRSSLKSAIWERFSIFQGSKNDPWGDIFCPEGSKKRGAPNQGGRPGAALDATCDPKRTRG